jgi:segregation and condensation protein B
LSETADPAPRVPEDKLRLLFALLFSSPEAVTQDRVRQVLYPEGDGEVAGPKEHLDALEEWMRARDLPLSVHQVGRSWRLLTSEDLADALVTVRKEAQKERLGPATLEVLALVAYRQPVLKADVDAIRGVQSGPHLRHLLDMRLVRILGRAELPGRPFLYGTTREFLDTFGLRDLSELPEAGRLAVPAEPGVGVSEADAEPKAEPEADAGAGPADDPQAAEAASEAQ